jgi:hypothetical protein
MERPDANLHIDPTLPDNLRADSPTLPSLMENLVGLSREIVLFLMAYIVSAIVTQLDTRQGTISVTGCNVIFEEPWRKHLLKVIRSK